MYYSRTTAAVVNGAGNNNNNMMSCPRVLKRVGGLWSGGWRMSVFTRVLYSDRSCPRKFLFYSFQSEGKTERDRERRRKGIRIER